MSADTTTCAKCGAPVTYETFVDVSSEVGYDCECGHSEWVHADSCTCDECEASRADDTDAQINEFCDRIKDEWDETIDIDQEASSTCSVYLTVYDEDGGIAATIRVSDHAPSACREAERGRADYLVIVGASDNQARALTGRLTAYGAASWIDAVLVVSDLIEQIEGCYE